MSGSDEAAGDTTVQAHLGRALGVPAGRSILPRILLATCCVAAGFVTALNLSHGRPLRVVAACVAWAVALAIRPLLARLVRQADRRRREIGEPFDLSLAAVLVMAGVVLAVASASSDATVVVFVLAGLLLGKVALGRWQPSKDPADYR